MDQKILEILLDMKQDITELKFDLKRLKDAQSDLQPIIENRKRVAWLGTGSIKVLTITTTILTTYLTLAKVLGY